MRMTTRTFRRMTPGGIAGATTAGLVLLVLGLSHGCTMYSAAPLPEFPWPPPLASSTEVLPASLLAEAGTAATLGDIDRRLTQALEDNGYFESSYYAVPGGFALVTRLERIEPTGEPVLGPDRWSTEVGRTVSFSLQDYLRALFTARPGYYRLIVFILTDVPFTQSKAEISREEAEGWLGSGAGWLPEQVGSVRFDGHSCSALIYEFARASVEDEAEAVRPGLIPARTHLEKAGIWSALQGG